VLALPLYDDTPKVSTPVATVGLVTACVLVFLWQTSLPPHAAAAAVYSYGMIPAVLFGSAELPARLQAAPAWMTLVTAQFLHGGIAHIAGNMLYLWIFGRGVEAALGTLRFLLLYLGSGVIAALAQAFVDPTSQIPMIGASGAIAGVLGAYLVFNPRAMSSSSSGFWCSSVLSVCRPCSCWACGSSYSLPAHFGQRERAGRGLLGPCWGIRRRHLLFAPAAPAWHAAAATAP
jgi:membrane associated rhomboid family serine protease